MNSEEQQEKLRELINILCRASNELCDSDDLKITENVNKEFLTEFKKAVEDGFNVKTKLVISHGGKFERFGSEDIYYDSTILYVAARSSHSNATIIQTLLDTQQFTSDNVGQALWGSAVYSNVETAKYLLDNRSEFSIQECHIEEAFVSAAAMQNIGTVNMFLEHHNGIKVNSALKVIQQEIYSPNTDSNRRQGLEKTMVYINENNEKVKQLQQEVPQSTQTIKEGKTFGNQEILNSNGESEENNDNNQAKDQLVAKQSTDNDDETSSVTSIDNPVFPNSSYKQLVADSTVVTTLGEQDDDASQTNKSTIVAISLVAVAVIAVAVSVYLEMLRVGVVVGACCVVAAAIVCYCDKPAVSNKNLASSLEDIDTSMPQYNSDYYKEI